MELAVIVLNYASGEDTVKCVDTLLGYHLDINIVIVDNMSPDNSYDMLAQRYEPEESVDVIRSDKNGGYSYGNNYGIKYAVEKYGSRAVAILNPDVIIPYKDFFDNLYSLLFSDDTFAVIGAQTVSNGTFNVNHSAWDIPTASRLIKYNLLLNKTRYRRTYTFNMISPGLLQTECIAGCCFMAKTDVFESVGFFDENVFLYNEENILGIKLKKAGYKEIVSLRDYYHHNHSARKPAKTFAAKISGVKAGFKSTKYLLSEYYSKAWLPLLYTVEGINRIYLMGCYIIKDKLLMRRKGK